MFGELIAEELHGTLSHINCTLASLASFWGVGGPQIRINQLRNSGSEDAHGKLVFFLGVPWVPGAQQRWKT